MKHILLCMILWMGIAQLAPTLSTQPDKRCFAEVSLCISGPIRYYWEQHGGLHTFGLPLTAQRLETIEDQTLPVQWFERDRLEIQANGHVTAGRLGARYLEVQGQPWQTIARVTQAEPGCMFFSVTGHQICEPFLRIWQTQGGVERFGYPLTERLNALIEGRTYPVQYFERRRMEYHAELAGTQYTILFGRLGAELVLTDSCVPLDSRNEPTAIAYRAVLGCPIAPSRELVGNDRLALRLVPLVIEHFEHGMLLWMRQFAGDALSEGQIFVITPSSSGQNLIWQRFPDQWQEGQPTGLRSTPPLGLYAPQRGFGYLWASNAELSTQLGWAIEPEQAENGGYRRFERGFLLYRPASDRFFVIGDDGTVRDVPRRVGS